MPRPIRIIILDDTRLLLNDLSACACARHRRTQENINDQHDQEEYAEGDRQPEQPRGVHSGRFAEFGDEGRLAGIQDEDAGGGHHDAVLVGGLFEGCRFGGALGLGTGASAEADIALEGNRYKNESLEPQKNNTTFKYIT